MIHIPIENATEDIDDEGTVIPPITADASKQLYDVATNIALSVVQCGATTSIDARSLLAQLKDLPLEYVQEVLAKVGGKSSKATMKRIMFLAKVNAEYLPRCLQLVPFFDNECSKEDAVNDHDSDTTLHFVDCIVQDDEKSDSFIALSCLEAGLHALHRRFPHLKQVILQSDNAKNISGKDMKMFMRQAVSSKGMELLAYHHNEAAARRDVCDAHFAHQQARVDAYIWWKEGFSS